MSNRKTYRKPLESLILAVCAAALIGLMPAPAHAQANAGALMPPWIPTFMNAAGTAVNSNGFICTYATGTTNVLLTYQDSALTIANQDPIRLNAAGRPVNQGSEVSVFLQPQSYRMILYAAGTGQTCNGVSVGSPIRTVDNVYDIGQLAATSLNCAAYSGSSASAQITNCANGLPAGGGTIDARSLSVGTWSTDAFSGITKSIDFICAAQTFTVSVNSTLPSNVHLIALEGCVFSQNSGITLTVSGPVDGSTTPIATHFAGVGKAIFFGGTLISAPPITKPGVITLGTTNGALPADTYYVGVAAVDALGLESGMDAPSTNSVVTNGAQAITVSWSVIPQAASYHVYVRRSADAYYRRYYNVTTNSATITVAPAGPVATAANGLTVTPSNTGGNLLAGNYYLNVVATFSDGQTTDEINWFALPLANISGADTGSIAFSWTAVTGATGYLVYIASDYDGGPRTHTKYFKNAGTSVTITGGEAYIIAPTVNGDTDTLTSGLGQFSVIQSVSNAKSFFAGDIQIAGTSGTDAKFQANRYSNVNGSQGGYDWRTNNTLYWQMYQGGTSEDLILSNNTASTVMDCIDPTNRCTFIGRTSFEQPIAIMAGLDGANNAYGIREEVTVFGSGTLARGIEVAPTIQAGGNNEVESELFIQSTYTNPNNYTGLVKWAINSLSTQNSQMLGGLIATANTNGNVNGLTVNGISNHNTANFVASSSANNSIGPQILAGTSSSDRAFDIESQSGATIYFRIRGDGAIQMGAGGGVFIGTPGSIPTAGNLTVQGVIAAGTNPAQLNGVLQIPNGIGATSGLYARNTANTNDIHLISTANASNGVVVDNGGNGVTFGGNVAIGANSGVLNITSGGSTTISTGVGSVRMSTANPATNAAWIPIAYMGTTYFVAGYTTNAP